MGSTYFTWGVLAAIYSNTEETVATHAVYAKDAPFNWGYPVIWTCMFLSAFIIFYLTYRVLSRLDGNKFWDVYSLMSVIVFAAIILILPMAEESHSEYLMAYRTWK